MQDFEKLGSFYLGKSVDIGTDKLKDDLVLYDAKDLNTHAVIIGMTGSGKTGLGIGLLEEAAIDNIPVIAIDPKGDMGNIMLSFPELRPVDFKPWVNPREASDKGLSVEEFAADQANAWQNGLARWGQSKERIKRLRDTADIAIFTPGSTAGIPVSVLKSFAAPDDETRSDTDAYNDRIVSTATSILALMNMDADPISSREHILISNILKARWDVGNNVDIPGLIADIQSPPVDKVGVLTMDSFFPPKERFTLAMRLNNLLAAPGFEVWMQGENLDAQRLLHTTDGKPRVSVMSIAHLSDSERMFFVTMLLNEVLSWMRRQPGTGTLRAILYMDEIFGYIPPTANPPSKMLFLTLLKQARAYGLGLVLATQNPVDLDYKGLSNTGTWFIGRLQTEQDKARVMDGLEGASTGGEFNRADVERTLSGLGKRRFLLHNVHETAPVVFQTRWVMSYLAGPFTRAQIKSLMAGYESPPLSTDAPASADGSKTPVPPRKVGTNTPERPALAPEIPQFYVPLSRQDDNTGVPIYYPHLLGAADAAYSSVKYKVHTEKRIVAVTEFDDGPVPVEWEHSQPLAMDAADLDSEPEQGVNYADLAKAASNAKNYSKWEKSFKRWIRTDQPLTLLYSKRFKLVSGVGESEGDFRARVQVQAHEQRDIAMGKLRKKYDAKISTQERKLLRAAQKLETEQAQAAQSKFDTAVSIGSAILGAFMSRKRLSATTTNRIGSAVKRAGKIGQQSDDVRHAEQVLLQTHAAIQALNDQLSNDITALEMSFDAQAETLDTAVVKATNANIEVHLVGLAWLPFYSTDFGLTPAWELTAVSTAGVKNWHDLKY